MGIRLAGQFCRRSGVRRVLSLGFGAWHRDVDRGGVSCIPGEMAEWLKAHAWKVCLGETLTWVRIPLSPPDYLLGCDTPEALPPPSCGLPSQGKGTAVRPLQVTYLDSGFMAWDWQISRIWHRESPLSRVA